MEARGPITSLRYRKGHWQGMVNRQGFVPEAKMFDLQDNDVKWVRTIEAEIDQFPKEEMRLAK